MEAFEAGATLGTVVGGCLVYAWHLFVVRKLEIDLFHERAAGIAEGISYESEVSQLKKEEGEVFERLSKLPATKKKKTSKKKSKSKRKK